MKRHERCYWLPYKPEIGSTLTWGNGTQERTWIVVSHEGKWTYIGYTTYHHSGEKSQVVEKLNIFRDTKSCSFYHRQSRGTFYPLKDLRPPRKKINREMKVMQSYSIFDDKVIEVRADGEADCPLLGFIETISESEFKATSVKGEVYMVASHEQGVEYLLRKRESKQQAPKIEVVLTQQNLF